MNRNNEDNKHVKKEGSIFLKCFAKSFLMLTILIVLFGIGIFFGYNVYNRIF